MNGSSRNLNAASLVGNLSNRSLRRPAPNANNITARFGDESDRNASSSDAFANGIISSTNIVASTISNAIGQASIQKSTNSTSSSTNVFSIDRGNNNIQEIKKSLTLDFTNPESAKKSLQFQTPETLSSLFGLSSAEFDKFVAQGLAQGVAVVQTPTPTQFFFPKNVTSEQEQYARGFLDALNQIYQRSGFIPANNLSPGFVVNTVAQEAKEGGNKDSGSTANTAATAVFPGPSTSSVSLNAAFVSNLLAAISTPTLPNSAVPEPAFVTTVSTSNAQQLRQSLAAAAAAASSSIVSQNPSSFYALGPRVAFPASVSNSIATAVASSSVNNSTTTLKVEPQNDRYTPSPASEESRSSSVGSSYREKNSNFGAGNDATAAAVALAAMNRGGRQYSHIQGFQTGSGFGQPNSQHQFLALTSAAQLLIGGHSHQPDHNLSSTASASSASSVSGSSMKMEIGDEHLSERFLPGTMPLNPEAQERLKLERKRARNRQAATKCRRRKLERIQQLEKEVAELEDQNRSLEDRRDNLAEEVQELRNLIEEHVKAKCNVVVLSQLPSTSTTSSHYTGSLVNRTK